MHKWTAEELEEVSCDSCGSRDVAREFVRQDGLRVVECAACGLAFLNPRPRSDLIRLLYGKGYFNGTSADRGEGGLRPNDLRLPLVRPLPRPVLLLTERFGGVRGKDVLEIGCATGSLLRALASEGARAKGVELSEYAAGQAREIGLDVATGTIEDYASVHRNCADMLVALEVIEHVTSPKRFLEQAYRLLRPGGTMVLSTPNYACSRRFGEKWLGFNASFEHIFFFSQAALRRLAESAGFTLRHVESSPFLGGPPPPAGFIAHQVERLQTVRYIIEEAGLWKGLQAIASRSAARLNCGVGHTLLTAFERDR